MPRPSSNHTCLARDAFECLSEPACLIRQDNLALVDWNRKAESFLGLSQKRAPSLPALVQPWNSDSFQKALAQKQFESAEFRGVTAFTCEGKAVQFDLLISEFESMSQALLVVIFADATTRISLEEQLRQAKKMETVGMLAGGIAHDFNNLLTIISGYSHMLAASLVDDDRNHYAAEQVIKASDRAAALTRQLLSFSRRHVAQSRVLDLTTIVQGMLPMLNRIIGEHIRLRINPGADLGRMHGDPFQIEQIVMNLVVNARDAMPNGGDLTIETANAEVTRDRLDIKPGSYIVLIVTDSGIGMDAATRERIFEPFFTTKEDGEGTGLGLSMVQGIAQRAGGAIDVTSEPGHGTSVKLFLPRVVGAETGASLEPAARSPRGTETVLLVEDDDAVRNLVKVALEAQGYRLLVAASGEQAMRMGRSFQDRIDLLVTDVVLPELNGKEVARRLHRKQPGMLVLFMSGYTDVSIEQLEDPQTRVHFIAKPFTPAALSRRIRDLLDSRHQHVAPAR